MPNDSFRIAVINPGSTSTKIALYENEECIGNYESPFYVRNLYSKDERLAQVHELSNRVIHVVEKAGWKHLDAIAARGGFLPSPPTKLPCGTYIIAEREGALIHVNETLVNAMVEFPERPHASNLGIPVAAILAEKFQAPAYFVDPVVVDEFCPEAEISGLQGIRRRNVSHALSVHAASRKASEILGIRLDEMNVIVAHLGGGITVAAVRRGEMIDGNIGFLGGGPFTPQRVGNLPLSAIISLCYSGKYSQDELIELLTKHGGLRSYLGEDRLEVIEQRIQQGDDYATLIVNAMIYQITKDIGAMYAALCCDVRAIVLTGGMARSFYLCKEIEQRIGTLAPIIILKESLEMEALALGVLRVLRNEVLPRHYDSCKNT